MQGPAVNADALVGVQADFGFLIIQAAVSYTHLLGVQGDFANPYLTLRPEFEARQVEIFGEMAKKGYIYLARTPLGSSVSLKRT